MPRYAKKQKGKKDCKDLRKRSGPKLPRLVKDGFLMPKMLAEHVYSDTFEIANVSTSDGYIQFRCNGPYDPEYSSSANVTGERNGQSRYFDQLQTLYDEYRVLSSKIEVQVDNLEASNLYDMGVFLYRVGQGQSDTIPTQRDYILEHPGVRKWDQVKFLTAEGTSNSRGTLKLSWNQKYLNVIDKINNTSEDSSNPATVNTYVLGFVNMNGTNYMDVRVSVRISYQTLWTQPKYLTVST